MTRTYELTLSPDIYTDNNTTAAQQELPQETHTPTNDPENQIAPPTSNDQHAQAHLTLSEIDIGQTKQQDSLLGVSDSISNSSVLNLTKNASPTQVSAHNLDLHELDQSVTSTVAVSTRQRSTPEEISKSRTVAARTPKGNTPQYFSETILIPAPEPNCRRAIDQIR